ncbi:MAG TPA: TlpA disulfide reductase family protein [Chloroflexota bacterium]|nr:TlpA disulfide reductase family protein [Chloroflexota bacterium]
MRRMLAIPPVAVGILLLLAYGFGRDPAFIPSPLIGHKAPAFVLPSTRGRRVSLNSFRGRPLVVNFWASWCVPCKEEAGAFVNAYRRFHGRVEFVGISYEDSSNAARSFMKAHGMTWPVLSDPGQNVAISYGVTGIPETFFINRRGVIVEKRWSVDQQSLVNGIAGITGGSG